MRLAKKKFPDIPVIIISGAIGEEYAIEMFKAGATDYVLKDRLIKLEPSVKRALSEAEELAKRKRNQRKIREQAIILAELYKEEQQAKQLSDSLNEINAIIMSTLDFDEIADEVMMHAALAMNCDLSGIIVRDGLDWLVKSGYGLPYELVNSRFSNSLISELISDLGKIPVIIENASKDERISQQLVEKYKLGTVLVVPLIARDELIGAIGFNYFSGNSIKEPLIDFATKLGYSITLAIMNSHLYSEKCSIADTLQQSLISVPAHIEKIEIGSKYQASTVQPGEVGGDFYEVFETIDGKVAILVGDVSGKGVEAASVTSLIKNCVKAYAYSDYDCPAKVIGKTDHIIKTMIETDKFATVFFGYLDKNTGKLIYCSAGHPPAIIRKKGSAPNFLNINSPAVGILNDTKFLPGETTINKGDILVVYTDGVTEARQNGEFFGDKRFLQLVNDLDNFNAVQLSERIYDEINIFTNGKIVDDLAILSISLV